MGPQTSVGTKEINEEEPCAGQAAHRAIIYIVLNLCFQTLIWMSALLPREHRTLKLNQIYSAHVLLLFLLCHPTYTCVRYSFIPEVCVVVWPAVHWFPENRINKEQPTRQPIHREAVSIHISYVQTVRTVDCVSWSHRFRMRWIIWSPDVAHLPIDHKNAWIASVKRIKWMCLLFLYQCQADEEEEPWVSEVVVICNHHTVC